MSARGATAPAPDPARDWPILFFRPDKDGRRHDGQIAAHQSTARIVLIRGGNRSGKSEFIGEEAVGDGTGLEPGWFTLFAPSPIFTPIPKVIWVAGRDYETVGILEKKIKRLLPPSMIFGDWPKKEPVTVTLTNGTTYTFKSYTSGADAFAGFDVDRIYLDEKPSEDIFSECLARVVDRRGRIFIAQTPTDGLSWVFHRIWQPWFNRAREPVKGLSIDCFTFHTEENPWLDSETVREFAESFDEDERLVRLHGEFMPIEGKPVFSRKRLSEISRSLPPPIWQGDVEVRDGRAKLHGNPHGALSVWKWPKQGLAYTNGWDVALGIPGRDYTSGSGINRYDDEQVYEWHGHIKPGDGARVGLALARLYNEGYLGWEVENHGHVWSEVIGDHYPKILYRDDPDAVKGSNWAKMGWSTNPKTKPLLIQVLEERLKMTDPGFRSLGLVQEMMTFIHKPETGRDEAADGAFDDRVVSHAIALRTDRMCPKEGPREKKDLDALALRLLDPRSRAIYETELAEYERLKSRPDSDDYEFFDADN